MKPSGPEFFFVGRSLISNLISLVVIVLFKFTISSWVRRRRQWHTTPVLLPGKSHGQRSLVGCSPWGHWELDTTQWLHFHFSLSCIGEGNGNPLQCSCLENPRDGRVWWAAVFGSHRVGHDWSDLAAAAWVRCGRLCGFRNFSISSRLSNLLVYSCLY